MRVLICCSGERRDVLSHDLCVSVALVLDVVGLLLSEADMPDGENLAKPGAANPIRPQHEILEELVASIRSIDLRIRSLEEGGSSDATRPLRPRRHRLSPFVVHELPHAVSEGPGDPLGMLVLAGLLRD